MSELALARDVHFLEPVVSSIAASIVGSLPNARLMVKLMFY